MAAVDDKRHAGDALGLAGRADEQRAAEVLLDSTATVQPVPRQFGREFVCLEPVFARVHGERSEYPPVEHVAGDFLEEQQAARP